MHIGRIFLLTLLIIIPQYTIAQNAALDKLSIIELDSIIAVFYEEGDVKSALPYAQQAMRHAAEIYGKEDSIYTSCLGTYAFFLGQNGMYEAAEPLMREELRLLAKRVGYFHPDYAMSLNNIAALYVRTEQLEAAEPMLKEALKIWEKLFGKQHEYYTVTLNNLAALYDDLGKYEASEKLYYEVLELRRRSLGVTHPLYAAAINNLAFNYSKQGYYKEAERLHREALLVLKNARQESSKEYGAALSNLAVLLEKNGNSLAAENLYLESLAIKEAAVGKRHPSYLNTLNVLAGLYLETFRLEEAQKVIVEALTINSTKAIAQNPYDIDFVSFPPDFRYDSEALLSLQKLSELMLASYKENSDLSKLQQAQRIGTFTMNLLNDYRQAFHSEDDQLRMSAKTSTIAEKNLLVLWELKQKTKNPALVLNAYNIFEQTKSAVLTTVLRQKQARFFGGLPPELVEEMNNLQKRHTQLREKVLESDKNNTTTESLLRAYNESTQQLELLRRKVEKNYPKYYKLKYKKEETDLKQIQAELSSNTAIIEYFMTEQLCMALCITENKIEWYHLGGNRGGELVEQIIQFRQSVSDFDFAKTNSRQAFDNFLSNSFSLYQKILDPVIKNLSSDIKNLIIIPDNQLYFIPFEALLNKEAKNTRKYEELPYLLLDYQISYDYAASLWYKNNKAELNENREILAMAATYIAKKPAYTLRSANLQQSRALLQDLPSARAEVQALGKRFQGKFITEEAATENAFKSEAAKYGVIHLALHSLMDSKYPILSGLLFSENGDSIQNNLLQSYEISQLELNANLVVLSACETGFGSLQHGEGVVSVGRAFMYAGVPSVLVSLWQIQDGSTAELMEKYYRNLEKGENKAAALQKAKIAYLKSANGLTAHPAFWAALIQLGDKRPIAIAGNVNNTGIYWMAGLSFLCAGGVFWFYRNRKRN